MSTPYYDLPGLDGVYLEDSYVLGIDQLDDALRFDLDVVLTEHHQRYRPPLAGEQYCYRRGTLTFTGYRDVRWVEHTDAANIDPDGSIDHGNIDTFTRHDDTYDLTGEWGHVIVHGGQYDLTLASAEHLASDNGPFRTS